jgi:hypothetical protein
MEQLKSTMRERLLDWGHAAIGIIGMRSALTRRKKIQRIWSTPAWICDEITCSPSRISDEWSGFAALEAGSLENLYAMTLEAGIASWASGEHVSNAHQPGFHAVIQLPFDYESTQR